MKGDWLENGWLLVVKFGIIGGNGGGRGVGIGGGSGGGGGDFII